MELGVLKHRSGELREALKDFDAALALQPDFPDAHLQRAETLRKEKRYRKAGQALDGYLKRGKPDAKSYLVRGLIHNHLREHEAAVGAFNRALMLATDADTLTQRGWTFLQLEAPRLALADFDASLKLRPAHASSLCGRGHARVLLGQVSEGVADGEAALRLKGEEGQELLVACIYARAAGLLALTQPGKGRTGPETRYEKRAAELVCQALSRVPREEREAYWRKHIQSEPALPPIRRHLKVLRLAPGNAG